MKFYKFPNYIGGKAVESRHSLSVRDKFTGQVLGEVALADENQVNEAVENAIRAFDDFKYSSAERRAEILQIIYDIVSSERDTFADLIIKEAGKPSGYAKNEIRRALDNLSTGIRETLNFAGRMIPMDYLNGKGKTAYALRVPYGPVLGISPFNFPLNLALHKIIPAIATGSPVILKPAPQTPLTMMLLAEKLQDYNLPKGILQVVMTDNENAEKLVKNPAFQIFSFTGSDKVGWYLKSISPAKKVFLEMGGNAAVYIDETADIKRAARKLAYGSFLYAGQICISVQRIYVHQKTAEEFTDEFLKETGKIKSGNPADEEVTNGPLISEKDLFRMEEWVNEAVEKGAEILVGGKILDREHHIFEPTVLTGTNFGMKVIAEEIFGPVVNINPVDDIHEAIAEINRSKYGLQHSIYSDSMKNIQTFIQKVDAGGIMVNEIPGFRIDSMPYGGMKASGIGREGARWAMEEYTQLKLITLQ